MQNGPRTARSWWFFADTITNCESDIVLWIEPR
eukprot:COSAG02_NODE_60996_length_269_cov_2.229412_1_plen_32_part_01